MNSNSSRIEISNNLTDIGNLDFITRNQTSYSVSLNSSYFVIDYPTLNSFTISDDNIQKFNLTNNTFIVVSFPKSSLDFISNVTN